jgi:Tol biopolymer transport system component/DNA-binding winged helix-turn-helix (wHTH) protein
MPPPDEREHRLIRFASFELDEQNEELRKHGQRVRLAPQPFKVLCYLACRAGTIVSREELSHYLWNGTTFVDFEQGLNFCISRIRTVLNDDPEKPRFVETIPRRGYRFIADITVDHAPSSNATPNLVQSAEIDHTSESNSTQIREIEKSVWRWIWIVPSLVLAGLALFFVLHSIRRTQSIAAKQKFFPLISLPGDEAMPAFSPDGSRIAFIWEALDRKQAGIYAAVVGSESIVRLTQNEDDYSPAWSPDGRYVAYLRDIGQKFVIEKVPALGGAEELIYSGLRDPLSHNASNYGLSFSPAGTSITFSEWDPASARSRIQILSLSNSSVRFLTEPPAGYMDRRPAFSPDGNEIAFERSSGPIYVDEIYVASLKDNRVRQLTFDHKRIFGAPAWANRQEIIYSSNRSGLATLWRISEWGGAPLPVERVGPVAWFPTVSPDGNQLAYENSDEEQNLWQLELRDTTHASGPPSILVPSAKTYNLLPQYSPDGRKIAFQSDRSGYPEVWVCDGDGSHPIQITSLETVTGSPHWSPDGRYLAFDSRPKQHSEIYVVEPGAGAPRAVASFPDADTVLPSWSRDGQWIYFASNKGGKEFQIWKVAVSSGAAIQAPPIQLTKNGGFSSVESVDGQSLFFAKSSVQGIWTVPVDGGVETLIWPGPGPVNWSNWVLSEHGIYFFSPRPGSPPDIDFIDMKTRHAVHIARLEKFGFYGLTLSPDGKALVFPQDDRNDHAILVVDNFQ